MAGDNNVCRHLANENDLVYKSLSQLIVICYVAAVWAVAGDNKQLDLRPADPFTRIDSKFNQVVTWSLHTFPEKFVQIGPAVFS